MNISKEKFIENIQRIAKHKRESSIIRNKKSEPIKIEDIEVEVPKIPAKIDKELGQINETP